MDRLINATLFLIPCLPVLLYPRYWLAIWLTVGLFALGMSKALFDADLDVAVLLRGCATAGAYNLALLLTVVFGRKSLWKRAKNSPKLRTPRGRWDWHRLAGD